MIPIAIIFRRVWLLAMLAVGGYLAVNYLAKQDLAQFALRPTPAQVLGLLGAQAVFLSWVAATWRTVVLYATCARLSWGESLAHFVLLALGKYIPGKVWGMISRIGRLERHGISRSAAAYATFLEQFALIQAGLLLLAGLAPAALPDQVPLWMAPPALLLALVPVLIPVWGLPRLKHWLPFLASRYGTAMPPVAAARYGRVLLQSLGVWLSCAMIYLALFHALFPAVVLSTELVVRLLFANTAGVLLGFFAVFAPGGIGVRESASTALLAGVLPLPEAVLFNLAYRVWLTLVDVVLGAGLAGAIVVRRRQL